MEQQFPIQAGEESCGTLTIREDGLYVIYQANCKPRGGVTRLILTGEQGEIPLGVLVPREGALFLQRKVSRRETDSWGIGKPLSCRIQGSGAPLQPPVKDGWKPCENPGRLFQETELQEACPKIGALAQSGPDGAVQLALPLLPGLPFPLLSVFCFGKAEAIGGQEYVVYTLKDGMCV